MSIKAITQITPPEACLPPEASALSALRLMLDKQVNHIAVCDENNLFVGMIDTNRILLELLPASARVEEGLGNLSFAGDALPLLMARLKTLEAKPVGKIADRDVPRLRQDSPILEATLLLAHSAAPLPVLDEDGRLQGMLSRRALLAYLMQREQG